MARWPEMAHLFPADEEAVRLDWQLPMIACQSVGASAELAVPAMAALACVQISIILVDDMLDEEPDGEHHRMGVGRAANLALALQSAATALIQGSKAAVENRAAASACLAQMALDTAVGQELDVRNLTGEENYWRVIRAKSTPFYGAGLQVGGVLGGAAPEVAQALYDIGVVLGEAVQIYDDLEDAFKVPANSDWAQGRNNLVILYGLTAQYPERGQFLELKQRVDELAALEEAQRILIRSGAVSYCVYQIIQRQRMARRQLAKLPLSDPTKIDSLLTNQLVPLINFLEACNVTVPEELLRELV